MTAELSRIKTEPREPLASEVSRRLIDYLMSGEVAPGERIPSERQLTEMLGVNRPTDREAIKSFGFETMRICADADFPAADLAFHEAVGDQCGNIALRDMLKGLRAMIQRGWVERTESVRGRQVAYDDHVPILEAIERRDTQGAREAMAAHMAGATERLLAALERRGG